MRRITCIILNYKTYSHTENCINDLLSQKGVSLTLIVIDNDKENIAFNNLKIKYSKFTNIHFISTGDNLGYARGNNYGILWAKRNDLLWEYIAIINNDIELPETYILENLSNKLSSNEKIKIISPKIIHKASGILQGPYVRTNVNFLILECIIPILGAIRVKKEAKWRKSLNFLVPVYRTMGSFFVIETALFEKLLFFDENTFLGSEEEIIAEKIKPLNYTFWYNPDVYVLHNHGQSCKLLPFDTYNNYFISSKIYYLKKYHQTNKFKLSLLTVLMKFKYQTWSKIYNIFNK